MGQQKQSLVIMTNGDVYYVEQESAKGILRYLESSPNPRQFYLVTDTKSGAIVALNTAEISSVVNKGASDA